MTNLVERDMAIEAHLNGWRPTLLIGDNLPAQTSKEKEFIRITVLEGEGFLARRTGILEVTGSVTRYPVSIYFDVFSALNVAVRRNSELCQAVIDHWHPVDLTPSFHLYETRGVERIGEESPRFHQRVVIEGFRDERKTV